MPTPRVNFERRSKSPARKTCAPRTDLPDAGGHMGALVDSNLIIDALASSPLALRKLEEVENRGLVTLVPTPALFEIERGLLDRKSRTAAGHFRAMMARFPSAAFDEAAASRAAEVHHELRRLGRQKGTVDVMLAGIALSGGHLLLSRDRDLAEIAEVTGLAVEPY